MGISANDIRKGVVIVFEGQPCKVMTFEHKTPGNLRAMVQTRMRNLITGSSFEHRFRSNETLENVTIFAQQMEYLYSDGEMHHFMNSETYEQVELSNDDLGDTADWLSEGLKIKIEFYEEKPIGIELPANMELVVVETEPGLKGATVSNVNKPAKLSNGVTIMVPPFIAEGEKIRVNPTEGKYLERVK